MSRKIKYDQYSLYVNFKSQNCFSITAQFQPTNEHFVNKIVQLIRINKETVYASLQKKSQKNLKCQFEQVIQDGNKYLQIVFIVSFDYLPQIRQSIRLEHIQHNQGIKNLTLSNIQAQISEMNKSIDYISQKGSSLHKESSVTFAGVQRKEAWEGDVEQGKYLVRISGQVNNPTAAQAKQVLKIYLVPPGQNDKNVVPVCIKTHHQGGYHYPFFHSGIAQCKKGNFKIYLHNTVANSSVVNLHFLVTRIAMMLN